MASFIGETNFLTGAAEEGALRLGSGERIEVPGLRRAAGDVSVRPEQVRLGPPAEGGLQGKVAALVYFGTDTHCHLHLADGTEVVARLQSPATGEAGLEAGQAVGIRLPPPPCSGWRTEMSPAEERAIRTSARNGWLLSAPALVLLTVAAVGPLAIVVIYSFLTPGEHGNVVWEFSTDGWKNILWTKDIFATNTCWRMRI